MHFSVEGRVYKVVEWMNDEGVSHSELLDVYEVTTPEPIRAIQISKKVQSIDMNAFIYVKIKYTYLIKTKKKYMTW